MRAVFIVAGAALIQRFHWVIYVFGAFLVVHRRSRCCSRPTTSSDPEREPGRSRAVRAGCVRVTDELDGSRFFVRRATAGCCATPLLLVLVLVEATDLVFAVDSIPAIFAITHDPFIVYTSNIFAILGLRSLYFLLAGVMDRFHYLKRPAAGAGVRRRQDAAQRLVRREDGPDRSGLPITAVADRRLHVLLDVQDAGSCRKDAAGEAALQGWVPGSPPKSEKEARNQTGDG